MIRLRHLLLHNYIYFFILFIALVYTLIFIFVDHNNIPKENIEVVVSNYVIDGNKLKITSKSSHIQGTYYIESKKEKENLEKNLKVGDKYTLEGEVSIPNTPTTKGLFNYKNYLKTKKVYYTMSIKSIKKISSTNNPIYILKNIVMNNLNSNPYLYTFLLGDKSYLNEEVIYSYQENGISHLFAISGMHISLLSNIILKILKKLKINENKRYFVTSILLIIYLLIVGFSPSILRGVLFFILFSINNIYYLHINKINLYLTALSITLFINPYYIYDTGFIYSFTISLFLLLSTKYLSNNNYFISLLKTSFISFLCSLPISLYNYSSINLLSIIYNLFFVPFISILIFPMSLIIVFIPMLETPYNFSTSILEKISIYLSRIDIAKIIFMRLNVIYYFLLFILIAILIYFLNKSKNYLSLLVIVLLIHYSFPYFINTTYIKMIDIGQGDSILLHSNNKNVLIDTGGVVNYTSEEWKKIRKNSSISKNTIIPLLKSLGVRKLDYLILTHGDYDHLGEALNIIDLIKVKKVVINCNEINYLENKIIKKSNNVMIAEEGLTIEVGDLIMYQLNEDLIDENDSSQIYYVTYKDRKILLTGDASIKSEKLMLEKYDLEKIDILKVGHHGSNTSTSIELLETLRPKIAIMSLGEDNKFGHPRKETLDNLNKYNVRYFRTDISGTITINLDNLSIKEDKLL